MTDYSTILDATFVLAESIKLAGILVFVGLFVNGMFR